MRAIKEGQRIGQPWYNSKNDAVTPHAHLVEHLHQLTSGRQKSTDHDGHPLDRIMWLTAHYESGGHPYVGYGGSDLTNAPRRSDGFPIWAGKRAPDGRMSHAAGLFGYEPATWARYAIPLGITDFSPESQIKVYDATVAAEGITPWVSNKKLMAALGETGFDGSAIPRLGAINTDTGTSIPSFDLKLSSLALPKTSQESQVIVTKPMPDEPAAQPIQLHAPHVGIAEPNLASGFGSALSRILRAQ